MTAEFNITIPGAEIIKRLADLETQVRDLANERAVDKVLVNAHTDNIAGLIDRMDRLTDFVNGKPARTPPYASTSRVERIAQDLAGLKDRFEGALDQGALEVSDLKDSIKRIAEDLAILRRELNLALANGHEETQRVERIKRDNESIGAYIQRLETDLGERLTAIDRARARGDDGQHDLVTRTANSIYEEVKKLEQRISDCELAVGTDTLDGAPTPNIPANDPEPPVDTSWHPYDARFDGPARMHLDWDQRVVVLTRDGHINGPANADAFDWGEWEDATIVAWRCAKEGE